MLIVAGGLALLGERDRPEHFRAIGLAYAFGCTVLFATRDNVVRHIAADTHGRAAARRVGDDPLGDGADLRRARRAPRGRRVFADIRREGPPFILPGLLWGASYAFLFEAFYRSRVSIVSPLVATESLFAVLLAVLLLRRTELVGRHLLLGAALVVAGGALIGRSAARLRVSGPKVSETAPSHARREARGAPVAPRARVELRVRPAGLREREQVDARRDPRAAVDDDLVGVGDLGGLAGRRDGQFTAPGIRPATGSIGSTSPR